MANFASEDFEAPLGDDRDVEGPLTDSEDGKCSDDGELLSSGILEVRETVTKLAYLSDIASVCVCV